MKAKKLLNISETKTLSQIKPLLEGTGYSVMSQVMLRDIISLDNDDTATLSDDERKSFSNQQLDFVILDNEGLPRFAVEFDGPVHRFKSKFLGDIRKNRFLTRAKIPLLRVDDSYIEKHETYSALEFIIYRFLSWEEKWEKLMRDFYREIEAMNNEELEVITQDGFLDPGVDPGVIFDISHPVPMTLELSNKLRDSYGIVTDFQTLDIYDEYRERSDAYWFSRNGLSMFPSGEKYIIEINYLLSSAGKNQVEKEFLVRVGFSLNLLLEPDFDGSKEPPVTYWRREAKWPIEVQTLPWVSDYELSEHMAEFIAHTRLLNWAKANLQERDDAPT